MSGAPLPAFDPTLLDVRDLRIGIRQGRRAPLRVVDKADFTIGRGEIVGLVGESGSGKSMICRSLIGTLPRRGACIMSGTLTFAGRDLASLDERAWRDIRGKQIGYVAQSALAGLNPVMTIEAQLREAIEQDRSAHPEAGAARAKSLLDIVHIRRPEAVLRQYPHQLSGGMRQRVMIACAIASRPQLLVADEPTTGLDVTVQAEIMKLLRTIQAEMGLSIILVSHDLALIDDVCERVVVMHAGACIETAGVEQLAAPKHPYTAALQRSRIELAAPGSELVTIVGRPPAVGSWQAGCRFADRCDMARSDCRQGDHPELRPIGQGRSSACLHWDQLP
ncbi:MAG: ABC transporter ATP-binding protein [Burkholderiales bacterium]|nr:ABC transporter ATP-binding protein [Burkholderiales bacterium]